MENNSKKVGKGKKSQRTLRILHIGNIANNAYLNAKILNQAGYDYYHIMGNPEWEEADFDGKVNDQFYPDWSSVRLNGFKRPKWFVQGPLLLCLDYLLAKRRGQNNRAFWLYYRLAFSRWIIGNKEKKWFNLYLKIIAPIKKIKLLLIAIVSLFPRVGKRIWRIVYTRLVDAKKQNAKIPSNTPLPEEIKTFNEYDNYVRDLIKEFNEFFPEWKNQLSEEDFNDWLPFASVWKELFAEYDVIHAYATDPIRPMIVKKKPYIAYEHGTIRSIPFEDNSLGRLTAFSYRKADGVIVTNCDNKLAAERLKLSDYRFVPHPVNEKWAIPDIGKDLRSKILKELKVEFLIFHPARQHWDSERHPSWEKGNDIFIEGLARAINEAGLNIGAVFVDWGQMVSESKDLIERLGISDRIKWVPPMNSAEMAKYIDASDLVADQFYLGAFGSILPKALMLGKAAIIYIDEEMHRWCFPEMPPVLNVNNPDKVFLVLVKAIEQPKWFAKLAADGKLWYQNYHSNSVILNRLEGFYSDVLTKNVSGN